jgi:hypothetical protein
MLMDEILSSVRLSAERNIYIGTLSRQAIVESGADHMGLEGYFIFEERDADNVKGFNILCKACSFEAALRIAEIWEDLYPVSYLSGISGSSPDASKARPERRSAPQCHPWTIADRRSWLPSREIDRMEEPSHRSERLWTRLA